MNILPNDKTIIRELAKQVAEIAAKPVQEEKRQLWRSLNGLKPQRPMVMLDQICWHELNHDGSLDILCTCDESRSYEQTLRRILYQWKHFPVDMVVEPFVTVPKAISYSLYGLGVEENTLVSDPENDVISHKYINVLDTDEDIEKITLPEIIHDTAETKRRVEFATELFDGILEVRPVGDPGSHFIQIWDPLSCLMGPDNAALALIDRPDFVHRILKKMTASFSSMLDQLEEQGLLYDTRSQTLVHCTGAYSDELPAPGYDENKPRCKDLWTAGLAQMFSMVSPGMHQEFELDYVNPILERFGLVYYGCCDPLDLKIDIVRKIPNLRKVSMSPWTKSERGAEGLGKDFVFSSKPNPANVAQPGFEADVVEKELTDINNACKRHGCPLELILKDISTVRYDPLRLTKWADIAMKVAMSG